MALPQHWWKSCGTKPLLLFLRTTLHQWDTSPHLKGMVSTLSQQLAQFSCLFSWLRSDLSRTGSEGSEFFKSIFFFFLKQTPGGLLSPKTFTYFTIFYPLAISPWCSHWRSQHPNLILGLGVAGSSVFLLVLPSPNGFLPIFLALFSACLFSGSLFFLN